MKLHPSPWDIKGIPSQIGKTLIKTQTAPKTPAPPITFSKKPSHPLRNSEAQKIRSKSRAPTANISGGTDSAQKQKPQVAETA